MIKNKKTKLRFSTLQLVKIGMLSSITVVLGATRVGFIPLPAVNATILHIPVIIGAILEGPLVGSMIGLIFGIFSLIQNLTAPTSVLSPAFINPLVSIAPRVLIGITSYYAYKLVSKNWNSPIAIAVGTAVGSLTNTVGVMTMIYLTYVHKYAAAKDYTIEAAGKVLLGIGYTYGIPEAIVAVLIVVPVVLAVRTIKGK